MPGANPSYIYTSQAVTKAATTSGTNGFLLGGPGAAIELQSLGNGQFMPISHEGNIMAY